MDTRVIIGLAAMLCVPAIASSAPRTVAGGIASCGGIGADERRAMTQDVPDANLRLEMFIAPGGDYVADVDLRVQPLGGGANGFSMVAGGPICALRLAPGRYRIEATYAGVTRSATATVPAAARSPARIEIGFPRPASDRYDAVPTPEEKQQARTP